MVRILGVDPGSITIGYGVIDSKKGRPFHIADGTVKANQLLPLSKRLAVLSEGLNAILNKFKPDTVAVEEVFYARNVKSAVMLAHARGIALLAAANAGLDVFGYSPMTVKQAVAGYGMADKAQVQSMVKVLLGIPYLPTSDAADALAIAICHLNHRGGMNTGDNRT